MKMNSISDARVIGGIGALLVLFFAVPNVGWLLGIAGVIMTLLAVEGISQLVNDKKICHNMRNAISLAIGAAITGAVTVAATVYQLLAIGSFVGSKFVLASNIAGSAWFALIGTAVVGLAATEVFFVLSALFLRRSYKGLATDLNVNMFEKAGLVYLVGASTVVVGVGFPLILIAEILLAVAFFSIRDPQTAQLSSIISTSQ